MFFAVNADKPDQSSRGDTATLHAPRRKSLPGTFRYAGAKWMLAPAIIEQFPAHYRYVEPFFGSGAVFFTKEPSPYEIVNDIDGQVVNFFRVLRERPDELRYAIETTPWSREEYDLSHVITGDSLEDARRIFVRAQQGHAADTSKKTGWRTRGSKQRARGMSIRWQGLPEELASLALRLKDAEIENRPAVDVIRRYSTEDALIYADPPYMPETRTQKMYANEMSEDDHAELLEVLVAHPGAVVLSGYQNDMYDEALVGWRKVTLRPPKVEKQAKRLEVLWVNTLAATGAATVWSADVSDGAAS
jgi:DNA adenine methylase